jgi:hypothetical protein
MKQTIFRGANLYGRIFVLRGDPIQVGFPAGRRRKIDRRRTEASSPTQLGRQKRWREFGPAAP